MRGRKGVQEIERRIKANPQGYRYAIRVNGRVWVYGKGAETMRAAADSASRGWAKGQKVEIVELNPDGSEKQLR